MARCGHWPVNLEIREVNTSYINPVLISTYHIVAMLVVIITMHKAGKKHDYVVEEPVGRYPLHWCVEHLRSNVCAFLVGLVVCDIALGWPSVSVGIRNGAFVVSPCAVGVVS